MMRTTLDINDGILSEIMGQTGATSKKKAVESALEDYLRLKRRIALAELIGNYDSYALTLQDLENSRESQKNQL